MSTIWDHANALEWSAGVPAAGALAYFYTGGTTTPLVVYSDAGSATPTTTPVVADANGRWPDVFIPYVASYDVKVTTSTGTQLYYPRLIPNADPATVATGTISTSSSQIFQTGGMRFEVRIGAVDALGGWVRANGLTIGNATSSATERANADTLALFTYLWNAAPQSVLVVSGGARGASAAADFAANKSIALPDMRGGFPIGADDMGNTAASRFAAATFQSGSATVGASVAGSDQGGGNTRTVLIANLAAHVHSTGTMTNAGEASHTHGIGSYSAATESGHIHAGTTDAEAAHTHAGTTGGVTVSHNHSVGIALASNVTAGAQAGGAAVGTTNTSVDSPDHAHAFTTGAGTAHAHNFTSGVGTAHTHTLLGTSAAGSSHTHAISGATGSTGADTPMGVLSRCILGTWLIKL